MMKADLDEHADQVDRREAIKGLVMPWRGRATWGSPVLFTQPVASAPPGNRDRRPEALLPAARPQVVSFDA